MDAVDCNIAVAESLERPTKKDMSSHFQFDRWTEQTRNFDQSVAQQLMVMMMQGAAPSEIVDLFLQDAALSKKLVDWSNLSQAQNETPKELLDRVVSSLAYRNMYRWLSILQSASAGGNAPVVGSIQKQQDSSSTKASSVLASRPRFSPNILVVDDSLPMRRIISAALEGQEFGSIVPVANGVQACEKICTMDIGLVICDYKMPLMSGLDLLEWTRGSSRFKHMPFILVTSEASQASVATATQLGVSGYVVKPIDKKLLINKINAVLSAVAPRLDQPV
ncbi:MAG: response regulator [Herminiimonas sp.]|nr:response regulator [Herminiimonas sp.]